MVVIIIYLRYVVTWTTFAAASLRGEATATSSTKFDGIRPVFLLSYHGQKVNKENIFLILRKQLHKFTNWLNILKWRGLFAVA